MVYTYSMTNAHEHLNCHWFASTCCLSNFSRCLLAVFFLVPPGKHFAHHLLGISCSNFPPLSQRQTGELHLGNFQGFCRDLIELFPDRLSDPCMRPSRVDEMLCGSWMLLSACVEGHDAP